MRTIGVGLIGFGVYGQMSCSCLHRRTRGVLRQANRPPRVLCEVEEGLARRPR